MKSWRVTKYNPLHRDAHGRFHGAEWTSVHDLSKLLGGEVLTVEEYLRVESAYLDTIMGFHADAGFPFLMVLDVELAGRIPNVPGEVLSLPPVQDMTVGRSDLQTVIRSCLREIFWCRLEVEDKSFMIHFGYDFYVYISGVDPSPATRVIAQSKGVFIEPCQSPYLGSE